MTDIIETLKLKLSSGNDIPVSRISLTREEAEAIVDKLAGVELAKDTAFSYAGIDDAHHKQWVIDQMLRYLMTHQEYQDWLTECRGDEDDGYPEWDTGIAP